MLEKKIVEIKIQCLLAQMRSKWVSWIGPKDLPIMEKKIELFQEKKKLSYED